MDTLGLQLWENPSGLSQSPGPRPDSECIFLVKSLQWSRPRCSDPENSGFLFVMPAAWHSCSAVGSLAVGLPACQGLAPPEVALASAKTSGHHRSVANPNSVAIPRPAFWLPRLPALVLRWTGVPPRDCHSQGSLRRALPQGSEERGVFCQTHCWKSRGSTQADCFLICLFLAQNKGKNLQFTRSFKMLALDSVGWKSNFKKQSSFSTGKLAFQPAPVNTMSNNTLTLNLQLKSGTQGPSAYVTPKLLTTIIQKHDVCNHFTYSLKPIKQWLHLKRFVNIMNIIIVGHKRLGLVPVLK